MMTMTAQHDAALLREARARHARILGHYSGRREIAESTLMVDVLELLDGQARTIAALERAERRHAEQQLLLQAVIRQHGGRLRISYGAMRDLRADQRIRMLADLTFRQQVLELTDPARAEDVGPAPWWWKVTARPVVAAVLGGVHRLIVAGMQLRQAWELEQARVRGKMALRAAGDAQVVALRERV